MADDLTEEEVDTINAKIEAMTSAQKQERLDELDSKSDLSVAEEYEYDALEEMLEDVEDKDEVDEDEADADV